MCIVSYIGDDWARRYPKDNDWVRPLVDQPGYPTTGGSTGGMGVLFPPTGVTQEQFNELKKEIEALKKLLIAAKLYDEQTGQKDCEMDEKVALIKRLAELVGVDMKDVFNDGNSA